MCLGCYNKGSRRFVCFVFFLWGGGGGGGGGGLLQYQEPLPVTQVNVTELILNAVALGIILDCVHYGGASSARGILKGGGRYLAPGFRV